eukprot:6201392-Pleurochrysis_carterae.AAC.5
MAFSNQKQQVTLPRSKRNKGMMARAANTIADYVVSAVRMRRRWRAHNGFLARIKVLIHAQTHKCTLEKGCDKRAPDQHTRP